MKTLLLIAATLASFTVLADGFGDETKFQSCQAGDMNLLNAATVRGNKHVLNLVKKDVIANEASCVVKKPRYIHPAVCGTMITQIDTFIINTKTDATYTVVVDSSYRSCYRIRVIPMIKSLTFEPTPRVVRFP